MNYKTHILPIAIAPVFLLFLLALLNAIHSPPSAIGSVLEQTVIEQADALPIAAVEPSDSPSDSVNEKPIIVSIYFTEPAQLAHLTERLDIWHINLEHKYVTVQLLPPQMKALQADGYRIELDADRTARQRELETIATSVRSAGQSSGIPGFACYRTVEETYADMAQLAANNPQIASWIDIGDSWDKVKYEETIAITPTVTGLKPGYDLHALVLTNRVMTPTVTTVSTTIVTETITVPLTQTVPITAVNPPTNTGALTTTIVITNFVPVTTTTVLPKPRMFLLAAVHARELTVAETAARFAEELVAGYGTDPDITWLLDYNEIHIVPQGNPDGRKFAEQLLSWRKNVNSTDGCFDPVANEPQFPLYGVDLNRNSSFKWNGCEGVGCSSGLSCNLTYRGSGPASEPEIQALEGYMRSIFADRRGPAMTDAAPLDTSGLMITMHSYSRLILYPWGFSESPAPNDAQLRTLANKFGYFTGYRACQSGAPGCIYPTDGTNDDWAYGELGVSSFTFELGTEFFQQCDYFEETILEEVMPSLRYAAKSARLPYLLPAGPETVDVAYSTAQPAGYPITLTAMADDTRYKSNHFSWTEPTQQISAVRYAIDAPAWITGTTVYTMTAVDGQFDSETESVSDVIDTAHLSPGMHTVFVESQDSLGNWGVASAVEFFMPYRHFFPFMPHPDLD